MKKRWCATPACENYAREDRHYCHTCRSRKWRAAQPISSLYNNLRNHAKARGKSFRMSIESFTEFCLDTGYHLQAGATPDALTVDRKNPRHGYRRGNIRAVTHQFNSTRRDRVELTLPAPEGDNPF